MEMRFLAYVAWYPDGTDGWEAAGLPSQEVKPEPASVQ